MLIISGNSHLHVKSQISNKQSKNEMATVPSPVSVKLQVPVDCRQAAAPRPFGNTQLRAKVWNRGTKSTVAMPLFDNRAILAWKRFIAFLILTDLEGEPWTSSHGPLLFGKLGLSADRSLFAQHIASVFPHTFPSCLPARTSGRLWPCPFSEFSFSSFKGYGDLVEACFWTELAPTSRNQWFPDTHS